MVYMLKDIDTFKNLNKNKLMQILKKEASNIDIMDIMKACIFLSEDAKYVQGNYREEYLKSYNEAFITRLKDLKEDKKEYKDHIDNNDLQKALKVLKEQETQVEAGEGFDPDFFKIYKIMSIYTTFILEESVHPPGTPFPGKFKVKYENGVYLCPVKENQKDNPGAVCGFCIALQDESIV
ncbi:MULTISPECIES: DUF2115 domain-containing protein [Methanobacterium]|uniref:UPF0305 protein O3H35_13610 n=1 Tax=Methanobacterium veterum TaxID=408577 RepID=A0A9E5DNB8_9EURY|nr:MULTISPECIES: DUF2115 domain-containing protein [Methanobacterium]MCZ3367172.1 DUF2115 domain-containing protein [Methanobacterium veterum]MCZ3373680.1 DUF2115 domain-containing protein [Methanobacterium veterum]